jgi:hypothetical protein
MFTVEFLDIDGIRRPAAADMHLPGEHSETPGRVFVISATTQKYKKIKYYIDKTEYHVIMLLRINEGSFHHE